MKPTLPLLALFLAILQGAYAPPPRCKVDADPRPWLDAVTNRTREATISLDEAVDNLDSILGHLIGGKNQILGQKNNVSTLYDEVYHVEAIIGIHMTRSWMSLLSFVKYPVLPCVLRYTYLQPYPTLLSQLQATNTTYFSPALELLHSSDAELQLAVNTVQQELPAYYDHTPYTLTVGALKDHLTAVRKILVQARPLLNKAANGFEKTVGKLKEKLKSVAIPTTTAWISPSPTIPVCGVNEEYRDVCSTLIIFLFGVIPPQVQVYRKTNNLTHPLPPDTCTDAPCSYLSYDPAVVCQDFAGGACSQQCACKDGYYRDWASGTGQCILAADCPSYTPPA
ncbi:hypothetical protein HDV00_005167 [Rhizophlyctis rosea]|nr:hypothetical protein HDV00_005167 [Rhizophlyctis rosea]